MLVMVTTHYAAIAALPRPPWQSSGGRPPLDGPARSENDGIA